MNKYPTTVMQPTASSVKTQNLSQRSWAWPNSNSMVIEETIVVHSLLMMVNDAVRCSATNAESQVTCIMSAILPPPPPRANVMEGQALSQDQSYSSFN